MIFCIKLTLIFKYTTYHLTQLFIMSSYTTSVINIYIPRILGDVSNNTIKDAFIRLNIGKVIDLDMHRKKNENGYYYFFAFIQLQLMQTAEALRMNTLLEKRGIMHLVYDEKECQYWEIKKHIPKNERKKTIESTMAEPMATMFKENTAEIVLPELNLNLFGPNAASDMLEQDKIDMLREYEELEREIYQLTCC